MTDIRSDLEAHLDALTDDEKRELFRLATLQTKTVWRTVTCKHCKRQGKYEVDVPLPSSVSKALKDLIEVTKGKVPERHVVDVNHWIGRDYSEWPEEALRAVAAGEVIEDAQFEALPERSSG